jgi:hypothetical protein
MRFFAAFAAAVIFQSLTLSLAWGQEILQANASVLLPPNAPNYQWTGSAYSDGFNASVYEQTIDFGKLLQTELPRHLLGHVSNVNVVPSRSDNARDSDLSIWIEIENVSAKVERAFGDHPGAASISFSIVAEIAGKEAWRKRHALKRDYLVPKGSAKGLMQITEATLIALFSEGLKGAVDTAFQDTRVRNELISYSTKQRQPIAVSPAPTLVSAPPAEIFPTKPVAVSFPRGKPAPDDVAVIIGNANYKATAKDIPDVIPAYADAEGMKRYATQALGIKEENVIFIKDARLADLIATFGNDSNPKGRLWNWVKAKRSQVFIFYSGHGAPSGDGASSYLVPVDATASLIDLSGYSLKTLYANLGKLPAKSVTVILEACFSGASQSGMLVKNASPIYQKAMTEIVPANLTVISAGTGNQIASWEQDKSHGLFTKHYLLGMAGAADRKPHGNGDGKVTNEELTRYLAETVSYAAQRYYGREQTAQIVTSGK